VVHGPVSTCNVTTELEMAGMDNAGKWWLVSKSAADLFAGNAGPSGNTQTPLVKSIPVPHQLSSGRPSSCFTEDDRKDEDSTES